MNNVYDDPVVMVEAVTSYVRATRRQVMWSDDPVFGVFRLRDIEDAGSTWEVPAGARSRRMSDFALFVEDSLRTVKGKEALLEAINLMGAEPATLWARLTKDLDPGNIPACGGCEANAPVAQWIEQRFPKPLAGGPTPPGGTRERRYGPPPTDWKWSVDNGEADVRSGGWWLQVVLVEGPSWWSWSVHKQMGANPLDPDCWLECASGYGRDMEESIGRAEGAARECWDIQEASEVARAQRRP